MKLIIILEVASKFTVFKQIYRIFAWVHRSFFSFEVITKKGSVPMHFITLVIFSLMMRMTGAFKPMASHARAHLRTFATMKNPVSFISIPNKRPYILIIQYIIYLYFCSKFSLIWKLVERKKVALRLSYLLMW